jgi:hypothetical protein
VSVKLVRGDGARAWTDNVSRDIVPQGDIVGSERIPAVPSDSKAVNRF